MADVDLSSEESRFRELLLAAGLTPIDDDIAAVLPDFIAARRSIAELTKIDLGDISPAVMFRPEGSTRYPTTDGAEAT
jgi:hypothetical protein